MMQPTRVVLAIVLFSLFAAASADAQTLRLVVHPSGAVVRVVSGAVGACFPHNQCIYYADKGATVRLAAEYPGRFSGGLGPAAGCALSTCSFTMTADADVTAALTNGDPSVTVTTTLAGDGPGTITADGVPCRSGTCTATYLLGSSVQLVADAGAAARFTGYSTGTGGASQCGGTATCTFTANGNASVTGTFLALTSFTVFPPAAVGAPGAPVTFTATGNYSGGASSVISPGKGEWSTAPSLPSASQYLAAAALGGQVYAVGGGSGGLAPWPGDTRVTAFDPATQMWTSRAPMLVGRAFLSATTAGGLLYAIGGSNASASGGRTPLASVERYDPGTNTWTLRAPMSVAREGLVTGSVNGIIYAAGGAGSASNYFGTLEAYDPATDTWTAKAAMPTPRTAAAGGVIDGKFYVVGGADAVSWLSTVEAYDPATNTWATKASMPAPLTGGAAAVADGVLYVMADNADVQSVVYAYDPAADAWSVKAPLRAPRSYFGAAALNGVVYAIGGGPIPTFDCCQIATDAVETYVDSLRWSSSAPSVARIAQTGVATPLAFGVATIVANVGGTTCGGNCPRFTVVAPTTLSLDAPVNNFTIAAGRELTIGGWALNTSAPSGTGVDMIHVHATQPSLHPGWTFFLGAAPYGESRPDVGAVYGSQFTNSGFTLKTSLLTGEGDYTITAYARNAITQLFDVAKSVNIHVTPAASSPFMNIDTPANGQVLTSAFEVGGWAIDAGAFTGTGVNAVQVYVFPNDGNAPGVFIGNASYGSGRADVGALFGSRFTNSGYHFTITGLGPGAYMLGVYARSTFTGTFSIIKTLHFTVSATALMSIDSPHPEVAITANTIGVAGWSIDRTIEASGPTGTGVDLLHVYAYPNPGSGQAPIFLGVASVGVNRPDVGALYGSRYNNAGYTLTVDRSVAGLAPGVYNIVVHSHSTVTGAFNNVALVQVTLQ